MRSDCEFWSLVKWIANDGGRVGEGKASRRFGEDGLFRPTYRKENVHALNEGHAGYSSTHCRIDLRHSHGRNIRDVGNIHDRPTRGTAGRTATATFGNGCFWCTEAVFQRLKGVKTVVSGYSGGSVKNPTYRQVCTGTTGHAEAIQITYDPKEISYEDLLAVFWHTHDPTTKDRQGNDVGTQYRSVIFYHSDEQKQLAEENKKKLDESGLFRAPIVTEIVPSTEFYRAEDYHQNYYNQNSGQPYCRAMIGPKLEKLKKVFKDKLKTDGDSTRSKRHAHRIGLFITGDHWRSSWPAGRARPVASAADQSTTIYRDEFGIPHIFAPTLEDAAYAVGYAQAEDRLEELLKNYRRASRHHGRSVRPRLVSTPTCASASCGTPRSARLATARSAPRCAA